MLEEFGTRLKGISPHAVSHSYRFGYSGRHISIDEVDHEILKVVARHSYYSPNEIARMISQPTSTVGYRMKRLRGAGVLVGFRYIVDRRDSVLHSYRLFIQTRGVSAKVREKFRSLCARTPGISYIMESLGDWDYELGLRTAKPYDVQTLQTTISEHLGSAVVSLQLHTAFDRAKACKYPFTEFPFP